jgi:hypothetical protein
VAQRAFRERKQEHLAELQERVRRYEQGEVERHVALQAVARRLKEENETLRRENAQLKEQVSTLEHAAAAKRPLSPSQASTPFHPSKRLRSSSMSNDAPPLPGLPPSPPLTASSWENRSVPVLIPNSPNHSSWFSSLAHTDDSLAYMQDMPSSTTTLPAPMSFERMPGFDCGFCSDDGSCLCAELLRHPQPSLLDHNNAAEDEMETVPGATRSILDDLPPYQAPVMLRRRPDATKANSVFAIRPLKPEPPTCSGDPSNCMACADDTFGQAFCTAVGESMMAESSQPCANCPRLASRSTLPDFSACIQTPGMSPPGREEATAPAIAAPVPLPASSDNPNVPCNEAWRQIKEHHPNASFADLRLLADVVARRSRCTGPRVLISPAPSDESTAWEAEQGDSITAVPPEAAQRQQLIRVCCGRPTVREVPAEAVRDAIRLLDVMHGQRN